MAIDEKTICINITLDGFVEEVTGRTEDNADYYDRTLRSLRAILFGESGFEISLDDMFYHTSNDNTGGIICSVNVDRYNAREVEDFLKSKQISMIVVWSANGVSDYKVRQILVEE